MKILAADTSTTSLSVCLADGEKILASRFLHLGDTHSRHLLFLMEGVLSDAKFLFKDLDALAVSLGPGSFTGLRIGVGTVKGLAMALGIPVFGFSTLAILAARFSGFPYPLCTMLDARRGEVYAALFDVSGKTPKEIFPPCVERPEVFLEKLSGPMLFVGSGALFYQEKIVKKMGENALWPGRLQHEPDSGELIALAMEKEISDAVHPGLILPMYLRKSDAELQKKS
ncbi:tRNA (adenosine(37)-N6)-threonylcarbamoyltransferase complex dimerization subunit type 1 TsaB [Desulfococcaceae bacterium OttesenSCG-928-F15]|nr:tRNA (adenosine(37)-N6)-threonylcarbamoyltransferase complex dimerization subunit type 1 TsaB [Desulfococcaceae bacterium OttesenSCG-928-F15]